MDDHNPEIGATSIPSNYLNTLSTIETSITKDKRQRQKTYHFIPIATHHNYSYLLFPESYPYS